MQLQHGIPTMFRLLFVFAGMNSRAQLKVVSKGRLNRGEGRFYAG